jgi:hypothetical protein
VLPVLNFLGHYDSLHLNLRQVTKVRAELKKRNIKLSNNFGFLIKSGLKWLVTHKRFMGVTVLNASDTRTAKVALLRLRARKIEVAGNVG